MNLLEKVILFLCKIKLNSKCSEKKILKSDYKHQSYGGIKREKKPAKKQFDCY